MENKKSLRIVIFDTEGKPIVDEQSNFIFAMIGSPAGESAHGIYATQCGAMSGAANMMAVRKMYDGIIDKNIVLKVAMKSKVMDEIIESAGKTDIESEGDESDEKALLLKMLKDLDS